MDNHTGAIVYLMQQLKSQEFKEAAMAYILLLQEPLTQNELDQKCEKFLEDLSAEFHSDIKKIDFEAEDAHQKLKELKLVTEKDGFLNVLPLNEAMVELENHWKNCL